MKKMKFKVNLSGDSIKAMLAQHSEKAVFGLIVLVTLMLMHRGYQSRNPFAQERSPSDLKSQADQARSAMREDTWADKEDGSGITVPGVVSARDQDLQLMERAEAGLTKISSSGYLELVRLWDPPFPPRTLRTDPELFTVSDLEVHAGNGPIAYADDGADKDGDGGGTQLSKAQQDAIPGFRPDGSAKARGFRFAVVSGKVPVQAQADEFDRCFKSSPKHNPSRDVPKLVYYYVQRAEVQPDGTDGPWIMLNTGAAQTEAGRWSGSLEEIVEAKFLDANFDKGRLKDTGTSMRLLPLMIRDASAWRKHSWFPTARVEQDTDDEPDPEPKPDPIDVPPFDHPEEERKRAHADESESVATAEPDAPAEFKMFRFFDLTVKPGRSYRYRVQLMLADPNDSRVTEMQVEPRFMDGLVIERLAAEAADRKSRNTKKGRYYRKSAWSEPSDLARVPLDYHLLGGKVQAGRRIQLRKDVSYQSEEPTGTVMTLLWDVALATDLPGEANVRRGKLLNYSTNVEAIEPVQLNLRTVTGYEFKTDTLVLDVAGGDKLTGRNNKDVLYAPGEMLLMDSNGNLVARDEMGDAPAYFSHKYSEPVDGGETEDPEDPFFNEDAEENTEEDTEDTLDDFFGDGH